MFICPVKNARLTSKFGWRTIQGKKEWHQGIDLASTGKVPIYASADGAVIRAGTLGTYGKVVMIQHSINGKRYDTNYAHLDSVSVKVGQKVKAGQQIGIMGNTGRSFGVHLHFEIHNGPWKSGQPNAVDPMKFIKLKEEPKKEEGLTVSQYNEIMKRLDDIEKKINGKMDVQVARKVSGTHEKAWNKATSNKVVNGENPQGYVTREQMTTILDRLKLMGE